MPRDTMAIFMKIIYCQCLNRCDIPGVYIQPLGMWKVDYLSVDFIEEKVMRQFSFFSFFLFPFIFSFFTYSFFFLFSWNGSSCQMHPHDWNEQRQKDLLSMSGLPILSFFLSLFSFYRFVLFISLLNLSLLFSILTFFSHLLTPIRMSVCVFVRSFLYF